MTSRSTPKTNIDQIFVFGICATFYTESNRVITQIIETENKTFWS